MAHFPFSDLNWRWRRRAKPSRKGRDRDGAAVEGVTDPISMSKEKVSFAIRSKSKFSDMWSLIMLSSLPRSLHNACNLLSRLCVTIDEPTVKRSDFPCDFLFGIATSAQQIEGSAAGGRGPSIWDDFAARGSRKIQDKSNASVAIDSYNRYKEDVGILKELGVNTYRFSISWSRILPQGSVSGGINQQGIDYYNNLINELVASGIKPFVTLMHNDCPQALQDKYGGFLSHNILNDFRDYCEICFKTYGDRVKNWITTNEPLATALFGYDLILCTGRCSTPNCDASNSSTEPYIVAHTHLLAHATAVKLYRGKFKADQKEKLELASWEKNYLPYSNSSDDKAATERAMDFAVGWFLDPLVNGDYPSIMRSVVKDRLPTFTAEEKEMVKGSLDFIGINYYSTQYARNTPENERKVGTSYSYDSFVNETGIEWIYRYPDGLVQILGHVKQKYQNPKIYITENGVTEENVGGRLVPEKLNDPHRIDCLKQHLARVLQSRKNGVNVQGYIHWSLADNWEWGSGFKPRFGLYYTDYEDNLKRHAKKSAEWYKAFLQGGH
ncbi:beta-glucosidase 24-like [Eucalyptus grandis]|uniref:beta-glucosidase 24-like n=1 Tax=Eucalyptus grandis TaxID=71139 RepID=UPI00192EC38C|nr:beta-glucosidase 24-like [Eucalyptus grandis]